MFCAEMEDRMVADMTALGDRRWVFIKCDGVTLLLGLPKQEVKRCEDILPLKGFISII